MKTALKDNDWRNHVKSLTLDEEGFNNRSKFQTIIERDAAFFAKAGIIDYSLLLGEILMEPAIVAELKERAKLEPDLFNGVYFADNGKAYVIGIIDPLTGYDFGKSVEYVFKKLYQNDQSCVPPDLYAQRF